MDAFNVHQLFKVLQQATSQNSSDVSDATTTLHENESKNGFYFALLKIALPENHRNIDWNIRWLAVLCLKNGIERNWRSFCHTTIGDDEKTFIRNEILSCFSENIQQIALQFAVIVSKIARFDFPKCWPNLLEVLLSAVSNISTSSMHLRDHTILLTLRYVVKELGSKQLPNDRKLFKELSNNIFSVCYQLWELYYQQIAGAIDSGNLDSVKQETLTSLIQKFAIILKTFRSMMVYLNEQNFTKLYHSVIESLQMMLIKINVISSEWISLYNAFHNILILHSKLLHDGIELDIPSVKLFLDELLVVIKQCIFVYSQHKTVLKERFVVNILNSLESLVVKSYTKGEIQFMETAQDTFRCLVFSYLSLTTTDLENWEYNPEEFCSEEIGESWKYNIRPSAEKLVRTLVSHHPEEILPLLFDIFHTTNEVTKQELSETTSIINFLNNDSVFTAIGLSQINVSVCLEFKSWFESVLVPYVKKCIFYPAGKIIHRRVLWLIQQWTCTQSVNDLLYYEFVSSSLDRNLDIVVRLTASDTLRNILDDFEFECEVFAPYQELCFDSLYILLEDVKSGDSKMRVLYVLSFLIERLGSKINPYIERLTKILPSLWAESDSHNMLRCAVVATLVNLVNGLKGNHNALSTFLTNVIHACTDISSPAHVYLLEDGLALWLAYLHNTNHMTENLLQLFNNIYGLLELSSESLKECLEIVQCYIVLGGEAFVGGRHGSDLALAISSLITDVRDKCLVIVAQLIDTMIKIAPNETPFVFQQFLIDTIYQVLNSSDGTVLATSRLVVISRLAFLNVASFWNLFAQQSGEQITEAALSFLKIVSERIDSVVETVERKVVALACLGLLDSFKDSNSLQKALSYVLCIAVQVLYDVCDENGIDTFVTDAAATDLQPESDDTHHSIRMRALIRSDPNHKLSLPDVTKVTLEHLSKICGGTEILHGLILNAVGKDILDELQYFLK